MTTIRYHLFIVDDEPTIRDGIALALGEDYRITAFANAEDALADLEKAAPDLVLLDVMLPGIGGFDLLRELLDLSSCRGLGAALLDAMRKQ